jgi:1,4-dihydroxy-2-naphthoate octaprenyltransferase
MYVVMLVLAFLVAPLPWILGSDSVGPWALLAWLAFPLALKLVQVVRSRVEGPALNGALAGTGRLQLVFCVLLSIGLLAS